MVILKLNALVSCYCPEQFGDASGIQSPVSFGGFGSLTRHLGRLSAGIHLSLTKKRIWSSYFHVCHATLVTLNDIAFIGSLPTII